MLPLGDQSRNAHLVISRVYDSLFFDSRYVQIVTEYVQEIPQSQTADKPTAPQGRATQQSRDT